MKKVEVGEKRPLSHGYMVDHGAKKAEQDLIQDKTDEFLAEGGNIEQIADGVMAALTKGPQPIRISNG